MEEEVLFLLIFYQSTKFINISKFLSERLQWQVYQLKTSYPSFHPMDDSHSSDAGALQLGIIISCCLL